VTPRVGFIGVGKIGRPMAERLVAAGLDPLVYDVSADALRAIAAAGARTAASAREVGAGCDGSHHHLRHADLLRSVGEVGAGQRQGLERVLPLEVVGGHLGRGQVDQQHVARQERGLLGGCDDVGGIPAPALDGDEVRAREAAQAELADGTDAPAVAVGAL